MPNLSLDIPGGGGKVGLVPDFQISSTDEVHEFEGWDGWRGTYQAPRLPMQEPADTGEYQEEWERIKAQSYGV